MTRAEIIGNWDDLLNKAENGDSYLRLLAKCNEQKKVDGELGNFPGRGFESAWASFTRAIEHAHKRGVVRSALVTVTKDFQDSLPPREGLILASGMRAYCLADKFRTIASAAVAKNKFRRPVHIGGARALAIRYNADVPAVGTAKAEEAQIAVLLATKSGWADPENQARAAEFYGRMNARESVTVLDTVKMNALKDFLHDVDNATPAEFAGLLGRARDLGVQMELGEIVPTKLRVVSIASRHGALRWLDQNAGQAKPAPLRTVARGSIHIPFTLGPDHLAAACRLLRRVHGSRLPGALPAALNQCIAEQLLAPANAEEFRLKMMGILDHFHVCFASGQPAQLVPATGVEVYQRLAESWRDTIIGKFLMLREHITNMLLRNPERAQALMCGSPYRYSSFGDAWADLKRIAEMPATAVLFTEVKSEGAFDPEVLAASTAVVKGTRYRLTQLGVVVSRVVRPIGDMGRSGIYCCPAPHWRRTESEIRYTQRQLELVREQKAVRVAARIADERTAHERHRVEQAATALLATEPHIPRLEYEYVRSIGLQPKCIEGRPVVPHTTRDQLWMNGECTHTNDVAPDADGQESGTSVETIAQPVVVPIDRRRKHASLIAAISGVLLLLVTAAFKIVQALNGNHGEWTNGDDVPVEVYANLTNLWLRDSEAGQGVCDSIIRGCHEDRVPMLRVYRVSGQSVWARHPIETGCAVEFRMPRTSAMVFERCLNVTRTVFLCPTIHHWSDHKPIPWDSSSNRPVTTAQAGVACELNGLNGECTNTDDLAADNSFECAQTQNQMLMVAGLLHSEYFVGCNFVVPGKGRKQHLCPGIEDAVRLYDQIHGEKEIDPDEPVQDIIYRHYAYLEGDMLNMKLHEVLHTYLASKKRSFPLAAKILVAQFWRLRHKNDDLSYPATPAEIKPLSEVEMEEAMRNRPFPAGGIYIQERDWQYMLNQMPANLKRGFVPSGKPTTQSESHQRREAARDARAAAAAAVAPARASRKEPLGPAPEKPLIAASGDGSTAPAVPTLAITAPAVTDPAPQPTAAPVVPAATAPAVLTPLSVDFHPHRHDSRDISEAVTTRLLIEHTVGPVDDEINSRLDYWPEPSPELELLEPTAPGPYAPPEDTSVPTRVLSPLVTPAGWVVRTQSGLEPTPTALWAELAHRRKESHILYHYEVVCPVSSEDVEGEDLREVPARRTIQLANTRNGLVLVSRTAYAACVGWTLPCANSRRTSVHLDKTLSFDRPGHERVGDLGFYWHNVERLDRITFALDCESARHVISVGPSILATVRARTGVKDEAAAFALAATAYYDRVFNLCEPDRLTSVSPQDRLACLTLCYHAVSVTRAETSPPARPSTGTWLMNTVGRWLAPYRFCSALESVNQVPKDDIDPAPVHYHTGCAKILRAMAKHEQSSRSGILVERYAWVLRMTQSAGKMLLDAHGHHHRSLVVAEWYDRLVMFHHYVCDGFFRRHMRPPKIGGGPSAPPNPPPEAARRVEALPLFSPAAPPSTPEPSCEDDADDACVPCVDPGLGEISAGGSVGACAALPITPVVVDMGEQPSCEVVTIEGPTIHMSDSGPTPTFAGTFECDGRSQPDIYGVADSNGWRLPREPGPTPRSTRWFRGFVLDMAMIGAEVIVNSALFYASPKTLLAFTYLLFVAENFPEQLLPAERQWLRNNIITARRIVASATYAYQFAMLSAHYMPHLFGSSMDSLNGNAGEWTNTNCVLPQDRYIYGYIYGDVYNRLPLKECSPSLLYELKPRFWDDYLDRKPAAVLGEMRMVDIGTRLPFMIPTYPDQHASENHLSSLIQRVGCVFPTPDPVVVADFMAYDRALRAAVFRPYSRRVGFGEWLSKMQKNQSHGDRLRKLYNLRYSTLHVGEDPAAGIYEYSAFIKHEGWSAEKPKIPRAIQAPDPMFKCHTSSWVKSFDNALYESLGLWNVKALSSKQVAEKLVSTFNEGEAVFATDYTAFEGHHHGPFAQLDWEWMHASLSAVGAPSEVVAMIKDAILGENRGHFPTLRFLVHQRLMSGAAWTSSMNLRLNFSLCSFLIARTLFPAASSCELAEWVKTHFRGLFEGDDGIFRSYGLTENRLKPLLTGLGIQLKIETHSNYNSAMFCSLVVVRSPEVVLLPDPMRLMRKIFCVPTSHSSTLKHILGYQRSVALSYKYSYPNAPVIGAICDWMISHTAGYANVVDANPYAIGMSTVDTDLNEDGTLTRAVMRRLLRPAEPSSDMRVAVEENFRITLPIQLELERCAALATATNNPLMLCPSELYGLQHPADKEYVATYVGTYPRERPEPPGWHLVIAAAVQLPKCRKTHYPIMPVTD